MNKWKTMTTPKGLGLFVIGMLLVFGLKAFFNTNKKITYESVAPVEQADGNIHYTLYNFNPAIKPGLLDFYDESIKYEPWVISIPKEVYVYRPESLNGFAEDIGSIQVNNISINASAPPNRRISIFIKIPEYQFLKNTSEQSVFNMVSEGELIEVIIRGSLGSSSSSDFRKYGCAIDYEIHPDVYKLRDANEGEIPKGFGSYTYAGERGCFGKNNDNYYSIKALGRGYIGNFKCNENVECYAIIKNGIHSLQFVFTKKNIKHLKKTIEVANNYIKSRRVNLPLSFDEELSK